MLLQCRGERVHEAATVVPLTGEVGRLGSGDREGLDVASRGVDRETIPSTAGLARGDSQPRVVK
jgi:hypothetical protein